MKKILINCFLLIAAAVTWSGCDDKSPYDGGVVSPYIYAFDVLNIHKGTDVVLTTENMGGANSIQGVVVSDHTSGNMLDGYLMVQNARNMSSSDSIRAIAIAAGTAAANYKSGDLVRVKLEGKTLTRRNGMLQVLDVSETDIVRLSSGNAIQTNKATTAAILANPKVYESSQVTVAKATFNPVLAPNETYTGDKYLNDGLADLVLRTNTGATFANDKPNEFGNYTGVIVLTADASGKLIPHLRMRNGADVLILPPPEPPAFIITGICSDPIGTDADYEYIQFRALRDVNFTTENYSVVTCNNAGSIEPTYGWATGGVKTYKFDLTSGTVAKGQFFYVGGTKKRINGTGSTDISSSIWIRSHDYVNNASDLLNGAAPAGGNKTGNLLANSGNASGVAVFKGIVVDMNSVPLDVIFIGTGNSSIYNPGPPVVGYRITTTDLYDRFDPATGAPQEYYRAGTNIIGFPYVEPANLGNFQAFGGVYDTTIGRGKWTKFRSQKTILMTAASTVAEIENVAGVTTEVK